MFSTDFHELVVLHNYNNNDMIKLVHIHNINNIPFQCLCGLTPQKLVPKTILNTDSRPSTLKLSLLHQKNQYFDNES